MRFPNVSLDRSPATFTLALALTILQAMQSVRGVTITTGHCQKNISVKYQVPVTKTRPHATTAPAPVTAAMPPVTEVYVDYEERVRWEVVQICCPGYRSIIFGLCEALCRDACPPHSHCVEPNKCQCARGYAPSHHPNKEHQLICRPTCAGGCPEHSHCVAPSVCECRTGYRDASAWFSALRCERIHCGPDQRYDAERKACVRIEMTVEQLMRTVGERLAHGLQEGDEYTDDDDDGEGASREQ